MSFEVRKVVTGAILGGGLVVGGGLLLSEGIKSEVDLSKVAGCLEPSQAQKQVCQSVAIDPGLLGKNSVESTMQDVVLEEVVGGAIAALGAATIAGTVYFNVRPDAAPQQQS